MSESVFFVSDHAVVKFSVDFSLAVAHKPKRVLYRRDHGINMSGPPV